MSKTIINKFGLSRTIPDPIKREVRKKSHFGCVRCGAGICSIDHVDPEWKDAKIHDPSCMTLLCDSCHGKKTRGIISVESIKEAMNQPYCLKLGMPSDELDFGKVKPKIQFGNSVFINPNSLISIDGVSILSIIPPKNKELKNRYLLNAIFHNIHGTEILKIKDNVWFGNPTNWDIETVGKIIMIRSSLGVIALNIENIPNDKLIVHSINMNYNGYEITGDINGLKIYTPSNKELFALRQGGEITGDIALNIIKERIYLSNLLMKNTQMDFSGDVSFTHNTVIIDDNTIDHVINVK